MTAVEWMAERILKGYIVSMEQFEDLLEQAKQIEKQQIMKAVFDSMGTNLDPNIDRAELYYNETFKSE